MATVWQVDGKDHRIVPTFGRLVGGADPHRKRTPSYLALKTPEKENAVERRKIIVIGAVLTSLLASGAYAQDKDKAAHQAEVKAKSMQALQDFYKADAKLKAAVNKAPGYAVFTTYGLSFGLGGAGGKGVAHDSKSKKDTYMDIAQASAGLQIGASDTRYLFIFDDAKALADFIGNGWDASVGAGAGAGTGKEDANVKAGAIAFTGGNAYVLTKAGLQAGVALGGSKVWKDKDLN
jgi:lipid-binding SYLF domain-containing protein